MKNILNKKMIQRLEAIFKNPSFSDHKAPVHRRDLIKLGLIAGGGALMPNLFPRTARAQMAAANPINIPFLVFDCAGGAAFPGNFLVGKKGGPEDLIADYRTHGWNPRASGALDNRFGLPMAKNSSKILEGIIQGLPAELKENRDGKIQLTSFLHFSLDDTSSNRASALTLISRAGLQGEVFKNGLGLRSSLSGGNSDVLLQDSAFKPKAVNTIGDITSLSLLGAAHSALPADLKKMLIQNLKANESDKSLLDAYEQLSKVGAPHDKGDASKNRLIGQIYRVEGNNSSRDNIEASIVLNVLSGYTGPGAITIDGCDYHDGGFATGDRKDLEIGLKIGRAIHAAHLLKKPLMFQLITDGGVTAPGSDNFDRSWRGDSNQRSMSVLGFFHPEKSVKMRRQQTGSYTDGGVVEIATDFGKGPEKMVTAVLLNYLEAHGQIGMAEQVLGRRVGSYEIDELLVLG